MCLWTHGSVCHSANYLKYCVYNQNFGLPGEIRLVLIIYPYWAPRPDQGTSAKNRDLDFSPSPPFRASNRELGIDWCPNRFPFPLKVLHLIQVIRQGAGSQGVAISHLKQVISRKVEKLCFLTSQIFRDRCFRSCFILIS